MTREEILAMQPGQELDALVAEHIMGFQWTGNPRGIQILQPIGGDREIAERRYGRINVFGMQNDPRLKRYSTDISAAWQVVEKLSKRFRFDIGVAGGKRSEGDRIEIALWSDFWEQEFPDHLAVADTVPHAICLAALMTTLKEKHEPTDSR